MTNLIGEYECRLDPKGRLMLPAALKRQLPVGEDDKFVMNRGFEECLVLYPKSEWDIAAAEVNAKNSYSKDNRTFARNFFRGATEIPMDGTNRLLLPKNLLEYAGIDKDLILFAYGNKIEVWSKKNYETMLAIDPDTYAELAEKVMVKNETPKTGDVS